MKKFNPNTLYDIKIIWEEDRYSIDLAPSKKMLKYCTQRLNEDHRDDDWKRCAEDEADLIKTLTLYIDEYITNISSATMN